MGDLELKRKSSIRAVLLSLIWPGTGHFYLGQAKKAGIFVILYLIFLSLIAKNIFSPSAQSPYQLFFLDIAMIIFYFLVTIEASIQGLLFNKKNSTVLTPRNRLKVYGLSVLVGLIFVFNLPGLLSFYLARYVVQISWVNSESMKPTLNKWDTFLVDKSIYRRSPPQRGDIIVFIDPNNPRRYMIKRLVALGGEEVEIRNGKILIDDHPVSIPGAQDIYYLNDGRWGNRGEKVKVPSDHLYVLGDNTVKSKDSRYWGFVPQKYFRGKAVLFGKNAEQENVKTNSISVKVGIQVAFPNLQFDRPVDLASPQDGTKRLFVLEQPGRIRVFENNPDVAEAGVFLDITQEIFAGHMEEGLLGLAFHSQFKENGFFYIDYTSGNPRRTVIARYRVDPRNPNRADQTSKTILLEIVQPFGNHKGGQLAFGPDGFLYIAMGDGGSGGDPYKNGQNRKSFLGKILRIDVDNPLPEKNYGIPPDNPFVGNQEGFKEEIYAYGFRNPWRFSFDPLTGWLWAADVGQDKPYEEIDIVQKGKNYGWNIMEGSHCFKPPEGCTRLGLELPIWEYTADQGRCITGGYVYRGRALPELYGAYIYGDFMSGKIWALYYDGKTRPQNHLLADNPVLYPASFGVDADGEIFICSYDGHIYQLRLIR